MQQVSTFKTTDMHGVTSYEVVQLAPGKFAAREIGFEPHKPYTEAELASMAESEAMYAAYEQSMREQYGDMWDQDLQHYAFTTAAAAQRAAELRDAMACASDEIDAFGAGGMGFVSRACSPMQAELDKLEAEFGWRDPSKSEFDAEIAHQRTPIRELLPGGVADAYGDDFVECCC